MTSNYIIAPSILSANLGKMGAEIQEMEEIGAKWLHIDVMDGSFVPPITFGTNIVKLARSISKIHLDVHLMINNPEQHIDSFIEAGCDSLSIHYEATPHSHRLLSRIREMNKLAGIAINPGTPVSSVFDLLEVADFILVMSVNPGWGGQKFIQQSLSRISTLHEEIQRRGLTTKIEVDGGINTSTAQQVISSGADILVAGNAVFGDSDRASAFKKLSSF